MPLLLTYIIKLSISLAVMYLFYQVLLRRLTFYNWNRWYLSGYSVVCFFIPLIDVVGMLNRNTASEYKVTAWIPSVESFTIGSAPLPAVESHTMQPNWNWLIAIITIVSLCMVMRLLVQYFSFRRIKQSAQLVTDGRVSLYYMALPIAPFSFGNAIFINPQQYNEAELNEIICHEMVHVQQRHSADAVWSEVLCILNWYNPFAWLIRKAIRQNLEFIADDYVLQKGVNKKAYQYLLLQTAGHRQFAVTNSFNFSSLKKRVTMMNKLKTAHVHLLRFLFVLPLMAILALACRPERQPQEQNLQQNPTTLWFSGLTLDALTQQPVKGVEIKDKISGQKTVSDDRGFFKMAISAKGKSMNIDAVFEVSGYKAGSTNLGAVALDKSMGSKNSVVSFAYLAAEENAAARRIHTVSKTGEPDYELVQLAYATHTKTELWYKKLDAIVGNSTKPIWVIDGIPCAIGAGVKGWFDKEEVEASPEFQVWVAGKVMSMDEANRTVNRFKVNGVGMCSKNEALKKYGVNTNLVLLKLNTREIEGDWTDPKRYASE